MGLFGRLGAAIAQHREQRVLTHRAIPEALWLDCTARLPFVAQRSAEDQAALRRLSTLFLAQKEFTGAGGLVPRDDIAVTIAVQACLPILKLGLGCYRGFVGIVLHPDEVVARREVIDDDGVVHEYDETLSGEAMAGGPVMLSWRDVDEAGVTADWAYNVVIHEFAHVLDMSDGVADGTPPLGSVAAQRAWKRQLTQAYEDFCRRLDSDPREPVIDPYGAEAPEEFFAVATEAFFVAPRALKKENPGLYELLGSYYGQDPALVVG